MAIKEAQILFNNIQHRIIAPKNLFGIIISKQAICQTNYLSATMIPQHLLLLMPMAAAYAVNPQLSFVGNRASRATPLHQASFIMDMETAMLDSVTRNDVGNIVETDHLEGPSYPRGRTGARCSCGHCYPVDLAQLSWRGRRLKSQP